MQQFNVLRLTYAPVLAMASTIAALAASIVTAVVVLHALHELGLRSPLYRKRPPVGGWSRRFYPAASLLIVFLLLLMWLLRGWDYRLHTS